MGIDYYGCLGIKQTAALEDIFHAYRKLALKYHPSKNDDDKVRGRFELVTESFQVLSNLKTKAFYDLYGEEGIKKGFVAPGGVKKGGFYRYIGDSDKTFLDFFGTNNPFQADIDISEKFQKLTGIASLEKDGHVYRTVECSLVDLYVGKQLEILHRREIMNGKGIPESVSEVLHIDVQPGMKNGTAFHFARKGDEKPGHEPADIIYKLIEKEHDYFVRNGDDLECFIEIPLIQALCGTSVQVRTLDLRLLDVPVYDIVQDGSVKVISQEGMPKHVTGGRGDLRITFKIIYPRSLNKVQRDIINCALRPKKDFPEETLRELCDLVCTMIPPSKWNIVKDTCFPPSTDAE